MRSGCLLLLEILMVASGMDVAVGVNGSREIYGSISWPEGYEKMVRPREARLIHERLLIDGWAFYVLKNSCAVYDENGTRLFTFQVFQHENTDYLSAYMVHSSLIVPDWRDILEKSEILKKKEEMIITGKLRPYYNDLSDSEAKIIDFSIENKKSLWIYCYQGFGIRINLDQGRMKMEKMQNLMKAWIDTQRGDIKANNDPREVDRREDLYKKRCREAAEKREYHTPQKAENEWNKESRKNDVIRIRWYPDSDGRHMAELLKIPVPKIHNTIPNINSGTACGSVSSLFGKKGYRPEEAEGGNDALRATFNNGKNRIHYLIYHAFNRHDAIYAMCAWPCYDGRLNVRRKINQDAAQAEDIANKLVKTEKLVGDLALYEWPRLDGNGALPPGRVKSAVWFVRGNTAVSIVSEDPYVDVLPYARAVDKELQKKAGAAAAPAAGAARKKE